MRADVVEGHTIGQGARAPNLKTIIQNVEQNLRPFEAIVTVDNRIDNRLTYRSSGIFSAVGLLDTLNLGRQTGIAQNKRFSLFDLLSQTPHNVLPINNRLTRFNTLPTDSRNVGMGHKILRSLAK